MSVYTEIVKVELKYVFPRLVSTSKVALQLLTVTLMLGHLQMQPICIPDMQLCQFLSSLFHCSLC